MTDREKLIDLIINAKRTDPETGSFTEYLGDFLLGYGVKLPDDRPVSREEVEKVWRGEWMGSADGYADGELVYDTWECSHCGYVIDEEDDPDMLPQFCPKCYAAMTDEAVDMMVRRWKEAAANA